MAIYEFIKNLVTFRKRKHESIQESKRARTENVSNGESVGKALNDLLIKKREKRNKQRCKNGEQRKRKS
ncbi:hypothetical protein THOM_2396 [Trachipleistophora hominis]|uniref:Uncharacterized protein n=1 Tax=Trachipleistophora hominis TaxID=72359 RepID=L7JVB5_TRAHO|nr:hypothetical protein THOM_2396 [Trachipleistophora hominis]